MIETFGFIFGGTALTTVFALNSVVKKLQKRVNELEDKLNMTTHSQNQ